MGRRKTEARHTGILLVDKPLGPTSHDVVGWVRWALGERGVGHCGTLDPMASGLLVVCVGEATKLVEHLTGLDKGYRARFVLGRSTTTADGVGETVAEAPVDASIVSDAARALTELVGDLELPPPAFSAVKVAGKRAHELARAGEAPVLAPRAMAVRRLEVLGCGHDPDREAVWADVDLDVAKGTYVRSLAEEWGRRLGLPAHMAALRRTRAGDLSVEDPATVTGLVPRELPALEGRPPRWRVGLPIETEEGVDRETAKARSGDALRERLQPPWTRLPFPAVVLTGEVHGEAFDRLLQGQRLGLDARVRASLQVPAGDGPCALVDRARGRMVVADRDRDRAGRPRLAPARVIRLRSPADTRDRPQERGARGG